MNYAIPSEMQIQALCTRRFSFLNTVLSYALSICLLVILSACTPKLKYKLKFNPEHHLRIAVMPFSQVDKNGAVIPSNELMPPTSNLLIDKVGLISSTPRETPTRYVRTLVQNAVRSSQLDLVNPLLIEIGLPHHGFGKGDGTFDVVKIQETTSSELCTHFLQCDAILIGKIHRWERNYYGIQSVNSVDIELVIRSSQDNSVLYQARLRDTDSRGIAGGPTGISDLLLEPIRGLDYEIIEDLARSVVTRLVRPLMADKEASNQAGYHHLPSIYAATHNAASAPLGSRGRFDVLLYGSPGVVASFRIGDLSGELPLIERSPGHYSGKYFGQPYEHFSTQPVFVKIQNRAGAIVEQKIDNASISKP